MQSVPERLRRPDRHVIGYGYLALSLTYPFKCLSPCPTALYAAYETESQHEGFVAALSR